MVRICPLTLSEFDTLPDHERRCVFWEVDPQLLPTTGEPVSSVKFDSEFDKEAWISMILLEWGTCGQIAVDDLTMRAVGSAFYAPPGRVPRAGWFPTAPISADAVILTSIRSTPAFPDAAEALAQAVIADLIRRGVRAIEAFGIVRANQLDDDQVFLNDICAGCMVDAHFLKDTGFDVVADHHRYPRFRLELHEGLGWKAEVQSALERLFADTELEVIGKERDSIAVPIGRHRH